MKIMEMTQNIESFAAKSRLLYHALSLYYRMIVKREIKLGQITKDDTILCIGGGACPYTAILMANYTKAKVTVVDNDLSCAKKASCLIERLGLEDINIICASGESISYDNYSVVHVALQITPKDKVIESLMEEASPGTRVLVRHPKPMLDRLYCPCKHNSCKTMKVRHSRLTNIDHTALQVVR